MKARNKKNKDYWIFTKLPLYENQIKFCRSVSVTDQINSLRFFIVFRPVIIKFLFTRITECVTNK